jgi:hypothetical protein
LSPNSLSKVVAHYQIAEVKEFLEADREYENLHESIQSHQIGLELLWENAYIPTKAEDSELSAATLCRGPVSVAILHIGVGAFW